MIRRLTLVGLLTVLVLATAGIGASASKATKAQAMAAGWDCSPDVLILGYFHCAPPGKPSLLNLVQGDATPASLKLNVYSDGANPSVQYFAGVELLIRADLFAGQPCPQEGEWAALNFYGSADPEYYACHRFSP